MRRFLANDLAGLVDHGDVGCGAFEVLGHVVHAAVALAALYLLPAWRAAGFQGLEHAGRLDRGFGFRLGFDGTADARSILGLYGSGAEAHAEHQC